MNLQTFQTAKPIAEDLVRLTDQSNAIAALISNGGRLTGNASVADASGHRVVEFPALTPEASVPFFSAMKQYVDALIAAKEAELAAL